MNSGSRSRHATTESKLYAVPEDVSVDSSRAIDQRKRKEKLRKNREMMKSWRSSKELSPEELEPTSKTAQELHGELFHERRKARALTRKIKELEPDYPVDEKGSLDLHDPRTKSIVFPGDISELSNVSKMKPSRFPMGPTQGTRGVPPTKDSKEAFWYRWIPDKMANATAYGYGIGDKPKKKRTRIRKGNKQ